MRIACIGTGYVGLVTGACMAEAGHEVVCLDIDAGKIAGLTAGVVPIYEPGLADVVAENRAAGRLRFSTDQASAVASAELIFIAVGTPSGIDGAADLSHVFAAARGIAGDLLGPVTIAVKSSTPPGTSEEIERVMRLANPAVDIVVVSNPEFLREGLAVADFRRPDRIVVGATDERGRDAMRAAYAGQIGSGVPVLFVAPRAAELIKYASNSLLAVKVAFINEMADLAEALGSDIEDVARGIGLDHRIGAHFLRAGPGYGGSCLPKDTLALTTLAGDVGAPQRVIEAAIHANADRRSRIMVRKVVEACGGSVRDKRIAVLGLAFKAETDDVRESPAIDIVRGLAQQGADVVAFDPKAMPGAAPLLRNVAFARDVDEAIAGAHAVVIATEWPEFRSIDLPGAARAMRGKAVVDLRNVLDRTAVEAAGLAYTGVGRGGGRASRPRPRRTSAPGRRVRTR